jgi:signal transduction histidine kinase
VVIVSVASGGHLSDLFWIALIAGGTCTAGSAVRAWRLQAVELADLAHRLELANDDNARAAVTQERARIARELHDVVAHSVSVMVVQAGAAEQVLPDELAPAREAMLAVQQTGREALVELRRLLGVLREGAVPSRGPQPGLAALDTLVEQVRDAGLDVALHVERNGETLAPGLDLAAYRIVQEALTNSLKHADANRADVTVRVTSSALELEIVDDGRGAGEPAERGHGLIGMRERALLYGGELEAGPGTGRGFTVRARLPLTELA